MVLYLHKQALPPFLHLFLCLTRWKKRRDLKLHLSRKWWTGERKASKTSLVLQSQMFRRWQSPTSSVLPPSGHYFHGTRVSWIEQMWLTTGPDGKSLVDSSWVFSKRQETEQTSAFPLNITTSKFQWGESELLKKLILTPASVFVPSLGFSVCDVSPWSLVVMEFLHPLVSFWPGDSSVQDSSLGSSNPGKQMTTKYQWALSGQRLFSIDTRSKRHVFKIRKDRKITHSWLTGTNRKSFLKMSTCRVHVFTRWCLLCLWQLLSNKDTVKNFKKRSLIKGSNHSAFLFFFKF